MATSTMKKVAAALVGAGICFGAMAAFGIGTAVAQDSEGYGYEFEDDPLSAGGFGPNDAIIKVRPRAARTTLIRPRTSFVPEMLKSVENL